MASRTVLLARLAVFDIARNRSQAKYQAMIDRTQAELEALPTDAPPPELEPANDQNGEPTFTSSSPVELPSPAALDGTVPSLEEAPELARYVPTPEVLAATDGRLVMTVLGTLTEREEHELVSAWTVAGNRDALTVVATHVPGPVGDRAARALKRLPEAAITETDPASEAPTRPDPA